jgi:hypothetical protein
MGYVAGPVAPNSQFFQADQARRSAAAPGVLGANTGFNSQQGPVAPSANSFQQPAAPPPDPYAEMRNQISSGWDSYLGSLNDIGNNYLPQQQTAQMNIANEQLNQGTTALNTQKSKSLKDIAENTRNAFQAGNIYLGSRGAGDSSAAGQYSYALNKEAGKQTSDLNQTVNTNLAALQSQHDQQLNQIANWFSQAQQQLKMQMAQGQLGKSQDLQSLSQNILNQAIQAANQVKQETSTRYNALLGWAASNASNVNQLQQNIAGIPQQFSNPSFGGAPAAQGAPVAFNDERNRQNTLFQNPSWFS